MIKESKVSNLQQKIKPDSFSGGLILTGQGFSMRLITATDQPHGKCILLTSEGVAVIGFYDGNPAHYIAYSPLPDLTPEIKEVLRARSAFRRISDNSSMG